MRFGCKRFVVVSVSARVTYVLACGRPDLLTPYVPYVIEVQTSPQSLVAFFVVHPSLQVIRSLQRQLSIALARDAAGDASLLKIKNQSSRKLLVTKDALLGLGTMAVLCGDDNGGGVLYERAVECCR